MGNSRGGCPKAPHRENMREAGVRAPYGRAVLQVQSICLVHQAVLQNAWPAPRANAGRFLRRQRGLKKRKSPERL